MTRYLAGADVGGTFTDIVLYDAETRTLSVPKSTPATMLTSVTRLPVAMDVNAARARRNSTDTSRSPTSAAKP